MEKKIFALMVALGLCLELSGPVSAFSLEPDSTVRATHSDEQTVLAGQSMRLSSSMTYGPLSIKDAWGDTITFEAAKAERQTVQIRDKVTLIGGEMELTPYREREITLVVLKPGSKVSVSVLSEEDVIDAGGVVIPNGNGKFTYTYTDTSMYILDDWTLKSDLQKTGVMIFGEGTSYLLIYEDILNPEISFTDVPDTAYYAAPIKWAVQNGVTTGTSATTFSPDATCTVAQTTVFLWRANGSLDTGGGDFYEDVSSDDWYVDAANWAYTAGLSVGRFGGDDPCTRAMIMTYLWILAGRPEAARSNFSDVPEGMFYTEAVAWAVSEGITAGTSATEFSPDSICTRGQVMTFLYRAMA